MSLLPLAILALVQGITEFLPISSSGHLVLTWEAFDATGLASGPSEAGDRLALDVAVHFGTLIAVLLYFWRDVWDMILGVLGLVTGRWSPGARLALSILVGTLPVIVVGVLAKDWIAETLRSTTVIATTTIVFGLALGWADSRGRRVLAVEDLGPLGGLLIGLAQVLALVPGTSRSGITMTAARMLGYERADAARISLLLAIPAILGAATLLGRDIYASGNLQLGADALIGVVLSFVSAVAAIALMMSWLKHATFGVFVYYRLALGALLFALIWTGVLPA